MELVRADVLLAGAHEVDRLKPLMQWCVAVLKDRSDAHGELLSAVTTLPQAVADHALGVLLGRLGADALQLVDAPHGAAVRTDRTIRPQHRF